MKLRNLFYRLSQTRLTLALSLVVLFSLLHYAMVGHLQGRVDQELAQFPGPKRLSDFSAPAIVDPTQNAAPYYLAAWSLCGKGSTGQFEVDSNFCSAIDADPSVARKLVAKYQPALQLVAQAYSLPECNYGLRYERAYDMQSPNFLEMRRLAFLLATKIRLAKIDHNSAELSKLVAQDARWLRTLEPKSDLISLMIRVSMTRFMVDALNGVDGGSLDSQARLELSLLDKDLQTSWDLWISGEVLMASKLYAKLVDGRESFQGELLGGTDSPVTSATYTVGGKVMFLLDQLHYIEQMKAIASKPGAQITEANSKYLISHILVPNSSKAHQKYTEIRTALTEIINRK
jgi:hypothetical protein